MHNRGQLVSWFVAFNDVIYSDGIFLYLLPEPLAQWQRRVQHSFAIRAHVVSFTHAGKLIYNVYVGMLPILLMQVI